MNRRLLQVIILAVCLGVIGTAYFRLLEAYRSEAERSTRHFSREHEGRADSVGIKASLVSLDPIRGEIVLRLQFEPQSDLIDDDDLLVDPVTVYTNSVAGKAEALFKKGESMQPVDVTLALQGEYSQYPWDRYAGLLWVCVASQAERAGGAGSWRAVPFTLDMWIAVPGFTIDTREAKPRDRGFSVCEVLLDVERSPSSRGFAVFIMLLIGLLTLGAFLVGFVVVTGGRTVETALLGWFGALLFAMVPLRNAMPGAPPIGCLADYMSFFWSEAIIAATLIAVVLTWVFRKPS